jgi:hypothetical protein
MKKLITVFFLIICIVTINAQLTATKYDPPIPATENLGDWGTDYVVLNGEPSGRSTGIYKLSNTTIYVAVCDTSTAAGRVLTIFSSTNNGQTWATAASISGAGNIITKTEMVRSGLDSIYCTFIIGRGTLAGNIFIYNLGNNGLRVFFTGSYRDFASWASSTGSYYLFADSLFSASIPRYASTNGGVTWNQRGVVTSAGANPYTMKSGSGDTAILLYYLTTAGLLDTTTAGITSARYRESAPGSLSSFGFIQPLVPAGAQKDEFTGASFGGVTWVIYTQGAPGSRDIFCYVATNGGNTFTGPTPVTNSTGVDEYWFDTKHYIIGTGGLDIAYYHDSAGASNTSDKIMYRFANLTTPTTFAAPVQISQFYPQPSSLRPYMPSLFEFYDSGGDLGVIWVGLDAGARKLYFDRYNATVGIQNNGGQIPAQYNLSQNYPNPFNPATKIDFAIPVSGNVSIKVFDMLGREIATIVNKEMKAGTYTADFDASKLSSGVYFYKLVSGNYLSTKKMVLVK